MVALAIFLAVVSVGVFLGMITSFAFASFGAKSDIRRNGFGFGITLTVVFVVFSLLVVVFSYFGYSNNFYNLYEEYTVEQANVSVLEEKLGAVEGDLLEQMDAYIDLDKQLVGAVKERNTGELQMLFERYPQLRAFEDVKNTRDEWIGLIDDVAFQKRTVNAVARAYNSAWRTWPSRWFRPSGLPNSLKLAETETQE